LHAGQKLLPQNRPDDHPGQAVTERAVLWILARLAIIQSFRTTARHGEHDSARGDPRLSLTPRGLIGCRSGVFKQPEQALGLCRLLLLRPVHVLNTSSRVKGFTMLCTLSQLLFHRRNHARYEVQNGQGGHELY
jgi:hypothetical protein